MEAHYKEPLQKLKATDGYRVQYNHLNQGETDNSGSEYSGDQEESCVEAGYWVINNASDWAQK